MRDILDSIVAAWSAGQSVGLATVVSTFSSAPRLPGSSMAVLPNGDVVGSVSGGCIDGAVYDCCTDAISTSRASMYQFGVSDESAFAVGLTCGGTIDVFVEAVSRSTFPQLMQVRDDIVASRPVTIATVVDHLDPRMVGARIVVDADSSSGTLGAPELDRAVVPTARAMLAAPRTGIIHVGADGDCNGDEVKVFVDSFAAAPRMIVFGGNDFARALIKQAKLVGFHVTLCDARPVFATTARFPDADEVVVEWPHRYLAKEIAAGRINQRTALCVLTHDSKFDIPLLLTALRDQSAGYVGAMGSRRTHEQRVERLLAEHVTPREIARLSSPIGLDLGASTPEETAVSIIAELVMLTHGGSPRRLSESSGRIHPTQPIRL